MANIKGRLRPEGSNNYADVIHLETTASQVIEEVNKRFMTDAERTKLANANVTSVAGKTGAVTLAKGDVGLGSVDNVKQMPIAGGTFTGVAVAQSNTSYTTRQIRNVILSTADPSGGSNGDVWLKYKP